MEYKVELCALVTTMVLSAYLGYSGGKSTTRTGKLLYPLSIASMVVALVAAVLLSVDLNMWSSWFTSLVTIAAYVLIATIPIDAYNTGVKHLERKAKMQEEEA